MSFLAILAQAAVAASPAPSAQAGVISYGPEAFAAAQPNNALDMLSRVPGFSVDYGDNVRGLEGAAGNVLIDGQRPTSKTDGLGAILQRIPASQVVRIDVIRGGAPGIDMQGKSVLANVIRKSGGGLRGALQASNNYVYDGRYLPVFRVELSGERGQRKFDLSARAGRGLDDGAGDGPHTVVDADGRLIERGDIDSEGDGAFKDVTGTYQTPMFGGTVALNGRLAWDTFKFGEVGRTTFPTPSAYVLEDVYDEFETEIGGRFNRQLDARSSLEVVGLRRTELDETLSELDQPGESAAFQQREDYSETIGRVVLKHQRNARLSFETGGELAFNEVDVTSALTENGSPVELPAASVQVKETRGEVFLRGVWRPHAHWTIEPGLRYEGSSISADGDVALSKTLYFAKPRLALTWAPRAATQVRARVERVVGQLDFDDFAASSSLERGDVSAGNPDLEPEQAWVAEAAVEQRFWSEGVVIVTARHFALTDVIDRVPIFAGQRVFDAPGNIGDGSKDELAVSLTLPLARLRIPRARLKGEVTLRRSQVTDPTTGEEREISGLRPLEWEAGYTQDLPRWRLTYGVDAYGGWRETAYRYDFIQHVKLKTFVVPFVEWKPRTDLSLRVELSNVTERGLRFTRNVYGGPRNLAGLDHVDDRDLQFGRMLFVRLRKTFGS